MEVSVSGWEGLDADCIVQIRAAHTRRQAKLGAQVPFEFPLLPCSVSDLKLEAYQPLCSKTVALSPDAERYILRLPGYGGTGEETKLSLDIKDADTSVNASAPSSPPGRTVGSNAEASEPALKEPSFEKKVEAGADAREYINRHDVVNSIQDMLASVLRAKPDDPYAFMTAHARGLKPDADYANLKQMMLESAPQAPPKQNVESEGFAALGKDAAQPAVPAPVTPEKDSQNIEPKTVTPIKQTPSVKKKGASALLNGFRSGNLEKIVNNMEETGIEDPAAKVAEKISEQKSPTAQASDAVPGSLQWQHPSVAVPVFASAVKQGLPIAQWLPSMCSWTGQPILPPLKKKQASPAEKKVVTASKESPARESSKELSPTTRRPEKIVTDMNCGQRSGAVTKIVADMEESGVAGAPYDPCSPRKPSNRSPRHKEAEPAPASFGIVIHIEESGVAEAAVKVGEEQPKENAKQELQVLGVPRDPCSPRKPSKRSPRLQEVEPAPAASYGPVALTDAEFLADNKQLISSNDLMRAEIERLKAELGEDTQSDPSGGAFAELQTKNTELCTAYERLTNEFSSLQGDQQKTQQILTRFCVDLEGMAKDMRGKLSSLEVTAAPASSEQEFECQRLIGANAELAKANQKLQEAIDVLQRT